jgi:hypothetical protein
MSTSFYAITAAGQLISHPYGDPEDGTDWLRTRAGIPWSPNVARGNVAHIAETLGIEGPDEGGEVYGDEPADLFLGRVLLALAVAPQDAGTPATSRTLGDGFGGSPLLTAEGRWYDCGRSEGYTQRKLAELRTLAEWAAARGHRVAWA